MILGLVPIDVLAGDREEIVDHDARRRLEFECRAEFPVHSLTAVKRRQLQVGEIDDAHFLVVSEWLVVAHDEGLPEMAPDEKIAEPPPLDRFRSTSRTDIDEVVG